MKKFFHAHPEIVIASLAIVFLGILVSFYSWAINDIYADVHQGLTASSAGGSDSFNLEQASKLDLRGIIPGDTSTLPVIVPPAAPAASTPTTTAASSTITDTKPTSTNNTKPTGQ